MNMLTFKQLGIGNILCTLDLEQLYPNNKDLQNFNFRWQEFFASDYSNSQVFTREGEIITYPHKSWIPKEKDGRYPVLFLFGNPASHSVSKGIYFAYEGKGTEHRFWKVFRELAFIDLLGTDEAIKSKFLDLNYDSPFCLGLEVIYTFPSTASKPKWSGVMGLERLFGTKAIKTILELEKRRLKLIIDQFLGEGGAVIAMQKDAYNAFGQNIYDVKLTVEGKLTSDYNDKIKVYGTPPTRWLHTKRAKKVLMKIKEEIIQAASAITKV